MRALERLLGRKTMENEILREALAKARAKKQTLRPPSPPEGRFPVKPRGRGAGRAAPNSMRGIRRAGARGVYIKAKDAALLPAIRRLVDERPTYGYRRITALVNRERRGLGLSPVNRKRVLRIHEPARPAARAITGRREGRVHDGKVMVMRSNLRWCSDALEFTCWNGERVRMAFIIDAFDREIIAQAAVAGAGICGSDIRDMMLEAVERRFGTDRAPQAIEHLSDSGSCYTAKQTRDFAAALGLTPCFTPIRSPESNGMSESFVKTLKRDYVRVTPLPDARTVIGLVDGWISDYNTVHPHSALRMLSPAEFREALNPSRTVR